MRPIVELLRDQSDKRQGYWPSFEAVDRGAILDLVLHYITTCLVDHALSDRERDNVRMLKRLLHIEEGEFLEHRADAVQNVLGRELSRILHDSEVDEPESLHQAHLQEVFDLGYDQYLELIRPQMRSVVARLFDQSATIEDFEADRPDRAMRSESRESWEKWQRKFSTGTTADNVVSDLTPTRFSWLRYRFLMLDTVFLLEDLMPESKSDAFFQALRSDANILDTSADDRSRRIPQAVKDQVWRRDGGECTQCGSRADLEFDHIIPFAKGGASTYRNVQLLCEKCNRRKSDAIG